MGKQQLIDWIKSQEAQGYTEQQLYNSLIQQGYNPNEVNEAIKITSQSNQQKDQTSKPSKSSNLVLFVIIGVITLGLIGGGIFLFISQNDKDNSDGITNLESNLPTQEDGLGVNLFTEKEIYEREEPFNLTLNIDYDGEPFKAAIIYVSHRKGFNKHFYKGYIEDVDSKGINRSRFHAGYPAEKAFRIYNRGHTYPQNFFLDEGTYYISVYVYDCTIIAEEGYNCTPSHVFPSTFGIFDDTPEDLIKNNVKPLASAEKEIIVKG